MGLTLLCTLEPGRWNIGERMIATRSLDTADKAANRPDWAVLKQLRRIQVQTDMQTTETKQRKRYKANKILVNVVEWEGAFGPEAPERPRSVIIILCAKGWGMQARGEMGITSLPLGGGCV